MAKKKNIWERIRDSLPSKEPSSKTTLWKQLAERVDILQLRPEKSAEVSEHQITNKEGEKVWILKNEVRGTYLKLSEKDWYVWNLIDGSHQVSDLVQEYLRKYGSLGAERIGNLLTEFKKYYLLKDTPVDIFGQVERGLGSRALVTRLINLKNRLLIQRIEIPGMAKKLAQYFSLLVKLFSNKIALISLGLLSLVGLYLFVSKIFTKGEYVSFKLGDSYVLGLLTIIIANFVLSLVSEGCKLASLKFFKLNDRKGGLTFSLGLPTFFCDSRDKCIAPRNPKLFLSTVGILSELSLAAIFNIGLVFLSPSLFNQIIFLVVVTCYLRVFIQLSPFLNLDGYQLLSDWLEVENLKRKALVAIRKKSFWVRLWKGEGLAKEEKSYPWFLVLAIFWILGAVKLASYLLRTNVILLLEDLIIDAPVAAVFILALFLIPLGLFLLTIIVLALRGLYKGIVSLPLWQVPLYGGLVMVGFSLIFSFGHIFLPAELASAYLQFMPIPVLLLSLGIIFINYEERGRGRYILRDFALLSLVLLSWIIWLIFTFHGWEFAGVFKDISYLFIFLFAYFYFLQIRASTPRSGEGITSGILFLLPTVAISLTGKFFLFSPLTLIGIGALGLLLPTLRSYSQSKLSFYWWSLVVALLLFSAGNVTAVFSARGEILADTLFLLASFLLLSSFSNYYLVHKYEKLPSPEEPWLQDLKETTNDRERLNKSFNFLILNLLKYLSCFQGERNREVICCDFNSHSEELGWGVYVGKKEVKVYTQRMENLPQLGKLYRNCLAYLFPLLEKLLGESQLSQIVQNIYDHLPWEEREVMQEYVLSELGELELLSLPAKISSQSRQQILEQTILFRHLEKEQLQQLASLVKFESHPAGQVIVRQEEKGDKFYLIWKGKVEIIEEDAQGRENQVAYLEKEDYFGEGALIEDGRRKATVKALTDLELFTFSREQFASFLANQLGTAKKLRDSWQSIKFISQIPLFKEFTLTQIKALLSKFKSEKHPTHTTVIQAGEVGEKFYLIEKGNLEVLIEGKEGKSKKVAELGPGEYFGEIALLADTLRTATVKTLTETALLTLNKQDFLNLVGHNSFLARSLEQISSRRAYELKSLQQDI